MKNKVDREYVILFVVAVFFSVVVPILVNLAGRYASSHEYDLNGIIGGKAGYKLFGTIMRGVSYTSSIAIAALLIIAIRYTLKWFVPSFIPRGIYLIMFLGMTHLQTFWGVLSSSESYMVKEMITTYIINIVFIIFIPFLWFVISKLFMKLGFSEFKHFAVISGAVVLFSILQTAVYSVILNSGNTNQNGIISSIGVSLSNEFISFAVMIVSYFLIKLLLDKIQKPIQIEALASE